MLRQHLVRSHAQLHGLISTDSKCTAGSLNLTVVELQHPNRRLNHCAHPAGVWQPWKCFAGGTSSQLILECRNGRHGMLHEPKISEPCAVDSMKTMSYVFGQHARLVVRLQRAMNVPTDRLAFDANLSRRTLVPSVCRQKTATHSCSQPPWLVHPRSQSLSCYLFMALVAMARQLGLDPMG
jgi:hypothetical protein